MKFKTQRRKLIRFESLEARRLLTADFKGGESVIIDFPSAGSTDVFAADLDSDGDLDLLSSGDKVLWFENVDRKGTFDSQHLISDFIGETNSVFAADLDRDGDLDVLTASATQDKIVWFKNADGKGKFERQFSISLHVDGAWSAYAADLDRDGDMDVLSSSANDDKIAWFPNTDGRGTFGDEKIISSSADGARSVHAADIDRDGDVDVLSASFFDDKIAWYENMDGQGTFSAERVITQAADEAWSVDTVDVDRDGDLDVLSASSADDKIAWYENINGLGNFGPQRVITDSAVEARSVFAADVDNDGDADVLAASSIDDTISWYENTGGQATFGSKQIIAASADGARSVFAADLDADGDVDIMSASRMDDKIAWYTNVNGLFQEVRVNSSKVSGIASVFVADVDRDGFQDILSASSADNKIAWYRNLGFGRFGNQQVITDQATSASSVYAADMDGDGDLDALSASSSEKPLAWHENTDGRGSFGPPKAISQNRIQARQVRAADLDGDGDQDVLVGARTNGLVEWYENSDGRGNMVARPLPTSTFSVPPAILTADLDGDKDEDVIIPWDDSTLAWLDNTNGRGNFGSVKPLPNVPGLRRLNDCAAADADGDGDVDLILAIGNAIVWFENTNGTGGFGVPKFISRQATGASAVISSDLDSDGDMDVLSASFDNDTIAWYENLDGRGKFAEGIVISNTADGASSVVAADLNNDGRIDIVSGSINDSKIAWYQNGRIPGDANLDGEFSSGDFVQVFQAGKYERGIPAQWSEGDWNGDRVFDSSDFVWAFQIGYYERGPINAIRVAAAIDQIFADDEPEPGFAVADDSTNAYA